MTGQPRRRTSTAKPIRRRGRSRTGWQVGTRRIRWLFAVYVLALLLAVGQLVSIQVVHAPEYADRSLAQRVRSVELAATRGRIYDRDGDVLATSVQSATVYADPRAYRPSETPDGTPVPPAAQPREVAEALGAVLNRDPAELEERLRRDAHFVYVARQLDWEVGERIRELELPGVGILTEPRRVYPNGELGAQVVGFTGIDGEGLQGLEQQYDQVLTGRPGLLAFEQAPGGLDIASGSRQVLPPEAGTDLVLSLDRALQHVAERAASEAVEAFSARGAAVVVLEVGTGEVLAMVSVPGFDPNHRTDAERDHWRNRVVTDVFEPGSTQKALTIAAAVDAGLVSPATSIEVPASLEVGSKRFTDVVRYEEPALTVEQVLARSSNVGTIRIAQQLGDERLDAYLRAFGYGRALGVGFPGESPGILMTTDEWWTTSLPTIAIGQGVAVTLLQLANAYAALANDGVAVQPRVVRGTVGDDGRLTPAPASTQQQVVSRETATAVRGMLVEAVSGERATGRRAQVAGYSVGGKTGTARKPNDGALGYSEEYVASFVGFAPANDPVLVVGVMVDEPWPIYGGVVAAPVFREVMEAALTIRRVPPDLESRTLEEVLADAKSAGGGSEEAARGEGPATDPDAPASPPVGTPAGGDGRPAASTADDAEG